LKSSFILLWSDMIQRVILISWICWDLLCVLKYDLFWRKFHSFPAEKYVYCLVVGWHTVDIITMSICPSVCSSSLVSLLIFCLEDLSIGDSRVFRSPTITVLVSVCVLRAIRVLINVDGCPCVWCIYVKDWHLFSMNHSFH
jgi:hypothetical protein